MNNSISIYVHIPFCNSKCYYCSFCSGNFSKETQNAYFKSLENEILSYKTQVPVKTIYFGGGTPSVVSSNQICNILTTIKNNFNVDKNAEITIEANPTSLTEEKLKEYKKAGFNRLSIGVQTLNKKSLKFIGRINNKKILNNYKKIVKISLKNAKKIGFNNISCDLMLGLPKNNKLNLFKDILFLKKYCTHFSCYMLMLEENTKLYNLLKNEDENKREDISVKQYEFMYKLLKKYGYDCYEISNFAKRNFHSKHNYNYWQSGNYLGFGLSAHSHVKPYRFYNTSEMESYLKIYKTSYNNLLENLDSNKNVRIEKLDKEDYAEEKIMLMLRTSEGINLTEFKNKFYDLFATKKQVIEKLQQNNFICGLPSHIKLTEKGIFVANQIIVQLFNN